MENLPTAWIVSRYLGVPSEIWMHRQIKGFRRLLPEVVTWRRENEDQFRLDPIRVQVLPFDPRADEGPGRWMRRLQNLPQGNFYGAVGDEFKALENAVLAARPSVILCHFGHIALRVLPVARKFDIPLVVHFHGMDVSSSLKNRWYRWSLLRALREFAAVIVVGTHQRKWAIERGVPEGRVHLIPCGVPTDEFVPPVEPKRSARVRIAAVSRLVRWKGVEESIRAFALLSARGIDAEFVIVGDGPQRPELISLAVSLGLQHRVRFRGSCGPEEVRQILSDSDVFVQHSLTDRSGWCEGFGVSLAEAAAMGLPVIATRSGGIADQVVDGETGILVEERDVSAMAEAIYRLANDVELRTCMGLAGRRRMIEHFDTTNQIWKLEEVLLAAVAAAAWNQRQPAFR